MPRFPRPDRARLGDTIPFFWDGRFHVFFLLRYADDTHDVRETSWGHYSTTDFIEFEDHGEAIPRSQDPSARDHSVATGSVVRIGDGFVAYYTGFSDWRRDHGGRDQTVLRATSPDLMTWRKDAEFELVADADRLDPHEWRDPHVVWDDASSRYRMLIAARSSRGPRIGRGLTAQAWSDDGMGWSVDADPFWAPSITAMHECPDLFRLGDRWYLVYSTVTDRAVTRYRTAPTPQGPWSAPIDDELDGLGFYAGKTVSDGTVRYLVGWAPNSVAGKDGAPWLWGGNLVVHEIAAEADGSLAVRRPGVVSQALRGLETVLVADETPAVLAAPCSRASRAIAQLPHAGRFELTTTWSAGTRELGLILRADEDETRGYAVRLQPDRHRIVVDRLDRSGAEAPYDIRFFRPGGDAARWSVEVEGELAIVYLDERQAITLRGYDRSSSGLIAFAVDGQVSVTDFTLWSRAGGPTP